MERPNRSAVHHGGARRTPEVPVSADLPTLAVSTLRGPTATGEVVPNRVELRRRPGDHQAALMVSS
jgi:hypothetical protein